MKPPHPTHVFGDIGMCLGCGMRPHWAGALDSCPVRHEFAMSADERARRRKMTYDAKKKWTERAKERTRFLRMAAPSSGPGHAPGHE